MRDGPINEYANRKCEARAMGVITHDSKLRSDSTVCTV